MSAKCGHKLCKCTESSHFGFCSEACRQGLVKSDSRCACGHPNCE